MKPCLHLCFLHCACFLLGLFVCLAGSGRAAAQGTGGGVGANPASGSRTTAVTHSIRGKLFLPSGGLPDQRIRVVLELSTGGIAAETFSDSVGNFEFRSVTNNTYRVTVHSDGHTFETA